MRTTSTPQAAYPGDLVEHLRAFAKVAEMLEDKRGGVGGGLSNAFARAASELAIDQSVLRRRLSTLEEFVGAPILTGRAQALRITTAGMRLRTQATQMIELARTIVTGDDSDQEGPLRVACTGTILAEVLPPVLKRMRERHPRLRLRVRREGDESSRRLLANGEIDFAIVRSTVDLNASSISSSLRARARRLAADRLWLAVPATHDLAHARRLLPEQIARASLIGYPPTSATMKRIMSVLAPHGSSPWIEVDRKAAALAYVSAGLGVSFISLVENQSPPRVRHVITRDVTALFPRMAFWLVWSVDLPTPLRGWRMDFLDDLSASLTPRK